MKLILLLICITVGNAMNTMMTKYPKLASKTFVMLPGFGNEANDYIAPAGDSSVSIQKNFIDRGLKLEIVPVKRLDWIKIIRGLLTTRFWNFSCEPDDLFNWYLDSSKETIDSALEKYDSDSVILVGHSAGGWLGRALIGSERLNMKSKIAGLITLGTPHYPPIDLTKDVTRGCLDIC